jgi:membrane associated rhomboid family serine protease
MAKHESFKPSDFRLRDIPGFLVIYLIISIVSVVLGLALETLADLWRGLIGGLGIGLALALLVLAPSRKRSARHSEEQDRSRRCEASPRCSLPNQSRG